MKGKYIRTAGDLLLGASVAMTVTRMNTVIIITTICVGVLLTIGGSWWDKDEG